MSSPRLSIAACTLALSSSMVGIATPAAASWCAWWPIVAEAWRKASVSRLALSLCLHVGSVVQVSCDAHHARSPRRCACTTGEDTMSITVDQTLLDAAQRIAPVIRAYNQEAEHRGRLSTPALDALGRRRLLTPADPAIPRGP